MKYAPLLFISLSAFAQMGSYTPKFDTYTCFYQGAAKSFKLQIESTMNPYKKVRIGTKEYSLGSGGGCLALSCRDTSLTLSNSIGSIKISVGPKTVEGIVSKKAFTCN